MTIGTYQELQVAVSNWLTNPTHSARVPELIALFEGKIKRSLRIRQMESRSTASTVASTAPLALPAGFLEMRNVRINTDPVTVLVMLSPHQMDVRFSSTGVPKAYKVVGSEIIFAPAPDAVYTVEMDFYSFTSLSTAAPTNWLLTSYPDAYLFGALSQAVGLGDPDPRAGDWTMKCQIALEELKHADLGARWNGPPMVAMPDFVTP